MKYGVNKGQHFQWALAALVTVSALRLFLGFKILLCTPARSPLRGPWAVFWYPPMEQARKEVQGGWGFCILYPSEGSGHKQISLKDIILHMF